MNVSNATARGLTFASVLRMLGFGIVALTLAASPAMADSARAGLIVGIRVVAPGEPITTLVEPTTSAAQTNIEKPYIGTVAEGTPVGACWTPPKEMKANAAKCSVKEKT